MHATKMATRTRHPVIRSGIGGRRARNDYSERGETHSAYSVRSNDGATSILAEAEFTTSFTFTNFEGRDTPYQGRVMSERAKKMSTWVKDRPLLLPYVAVISTVEFFVIIFKG